MIDKAPLQRAIDGATTPVYRSTFADVAAGFKAKYSAKTWTSEFAKAWSGKSDKKDKEYLSALRNIQRYEKGTHSPDKAREGAKQAIANAGKTLDPLRRDINKGVTVTVKFTAPEDKGHAQRTREFSVSMSSVEAYQFVNDPSYDDLFDDWFDGGADAYGDDGDYEAENVQVTIV